MTQPHLLPHASASTLLIVFLMVFLSLRGLSPLRRDDTGFDQAVDRGPIEGGISQNFDGMFAEARRPPPRATGRGLSAAIVAGHVVDDRNTDTRRAPLMRTVDAHQSAHRLQAS